MIHAQWVFMNNIFIKNHPRTNIRSHYDHDLVEGEFAKSFNKYYSSNFDKIHGLHKRYRCDTIREIPVSNLGIADMISISWRLNSNRFNKLNQEESSLSDFTLRAFEFKITDWKKGLMQAHRYSYFSHSTILVVHSEILETALQGFETFKKLNVGLWGYSPKKDVVKKIFTPRPNKKYVKKYFTQVTEKARNFLTESEPIA